MTDDNDNLTTAIAELRGEMRGSITALADEMRAGFALLHGRLDALIDGLAALRTEYQSHTHGPGDQ